MATSTSNPPEVFGAAVKRKLVFREILALAIESFRADKVRATMTALGMVIGTASLILVVTISLSGKQYVLDQIEGIGSNLIWVEYSGLENSGSNAALRDYLTVDDMDAVEQQVPGVRAASPVLNLHERITVAGGKEKEILILGVNSQYPDVRRLRILAGRFFDERDFRQYNKIALVTAPFAVRQYGSVDAAVGQKITLSELSFVIAGVFKEGVETFGRSDIQDETILIPYVVARRMAGTNAVNLIYFSMYDTDSVPAGTDEIVKVIKSRHRAGAVYKADNLTQVRLTAEKTANAFTMVLLLFAAITLIVGGVGIMNIMMATVSSRIREIGIRKAVGATRREIELQFLVEALLISVIGGTIGTVLGLAVPFSIRFVTGAELPVPFLAALVAIGVSCSVGIAFGTAPARRAASLDPVESLRHE